MNISYFFRTTPDFFGSAMGQWYSIILIPIYFIMMFGTVKICKKGYGWELIKWSAIILLGEQIIENLWFVFGHYLKDPLPLYHCRVAKILLPFIVLIFRKNEVLRNFTIVIGLFGSIISFFAPEPEPFLWPHFTNIAFYLTHALIGIIALALILQYKLEIDFKVFLKLEATMLIFNTICLVVSNITGSNYGFFLEAPVLKSFFSHYPKFFYVISLYILYSVLVLIAALFWRWVRRFSNRKDASRWIVVE